MTNSKNYISKCKEVKNRDGFCSADLYFANFLCEYLDKKISDDKKELLFLTAALTTHLLRNGNLCCCIKSMAETTFPLYSDDQWNELEDKKTFTLPEYNDWVKTIKEIEKVISNTKDNICTPLVYEEFDGTPYIYLRKYWEYENTLAKVITKLAEKKSRNYNNNICDKIKNISNYFINSKESPDYQQVAVFAALTNQLTLITGGPGTGKTTAVAAILAMLISENQDIKIKLCAPTGKAATRMKEAIYDELRNINISDEKKEKLTTVEASTIHRLLGSKWLSPNFKHNNENPITADVMIIDEASMISQSLMTKLFLAIPKDCKVILLGDKDQLAAVEEGTVLSDICEISEINKFSTGFINATSSMGKLAPAEDENNLTDMVVELKKTYRFDETKGIGKLKNAVNNYSDINNDNERAEISKALDNSSDELSIAPLPKYDKLEAELEKLIQNITIGDKKFLEYKNAESPEEAFKIMNEFKVLCSHKNKYYGEKNINEILLRIIFKNSPNYIQKGVPIMITRNDNSLKLYNGDIGILWSDENDTIRAYFPDIENTDKFKAYPINNLSQYKLAFAMTIHKSQGSGFEHVLMILPDKDSPILTKELIYTGITRAKKRCSIWGDKEIICNASAKKIQRKSGLKYRLQNPKE